MMKALALAPLVLAACADPPTYRPIDDAPTTPIAFHALAIACRDSLPASSTAEGRCGSIDSQPAVIATGGMQIVTLTEALSVGWSGTASDGYAVEPFGDVWPNTKKAEYHVRALGQGVGSFSISTNNGIAAGTLDSAEVARVAVVPGSCARGVAEVALYDASGRRLIDGSLQITGGSRLAWDKVALDSATLHVS